MRSVGAACPRKRHFVYARSETALRLSQVVAVHQESARKLPFARWSGLAAAHMMVMACS